MIFTMVMCIHVTNRLVSRGYFGTCVFVCTFYIFLGANVPTDVFIGCEARELGMKA